VHFVQTEEDSNGSAESINISRLRRQAESAPSPDNQQKRTFEDFELILKDLYAEYTFEFAANESA